MIPTPNGVAYIYDFIACMGGFLSPVLSNILFTQYLKPLTNKVFEKHYVFLLPDRYYFFGELHILQFIF